MPHRVLDCRIFFNDNANAQNAYDHLVALMQHAVAHDVQVGAITQYSWVRQHDCYADEAGGDTQSCATVQIHRVGGDSAVEVRIWAPGQTYSLGERTEHAGVVYSCLQPSHTTQAGWEPPNVPAIWAPVTT